MPRHPRVHAEGLLYHVMARGNDGQTIFLRQSDYEAFLEALGVVRKRYPFYLYAYVLMSNHFHLLLEVQRSPSARILQSLLTGYVRRFNKTHRHGGICFRGVTKRSSVPRELPFGAGALNSSQCGASRDGQAARGLAVERRWGILGEGKARTDRSRPGDGRA